MEKNNPAWQASYAESKHGQAQGQKQEAQNRAFLQRHLTQVSILISTHGGLRLTRLQAMAECFSQGCAVLREGSCLHGRASCCQAFQALCQGPSRCLLRIIPILPLSYKDLKLRDKSSARGTLLAALTALPRAQKFESPNGEGFCEW